jgi:hypothetical protein
VRDEVVARELLAERDEHRRDVAAAVRHHCDLQRATALQRGEHAPAHGLARGVLHRDVEVEVERHVRDVLAHLLCEVLVVDVEVDRDLAVDALRGSYRLRVDQPRSTNRDGSGLGCALPPLFEARVVLEERPEVTVAPVEHRVLIARRQLAPHRRSHAEELTSEDLRRRPDRLRELPARGRRHEGQRLVRGVELLRFALVRASHIGELVLAQRERLA